ncbi:MAG TPA: DNA/RNA non-specific endonuclease [Paludibacteraceae bacterium]|nr:DNA/RNA non-specific endonuclease [Paludibacteraceae bacterium]HQF49324.1 DNA/RNA non-specific endonuclease [Paludibacteraceae bacterium]HQJ89000.1 DNA/RNA non-specific endonuclease [Paludibacteraceae bacterium]
MNFKLTITVLSLLAVLNSGCSQQPQQNTNFEEKPLVIMSQENKETNHKANSASEENLSKYKGDDAFTHSNRVGTTYKHQHYMLSYSEQDEQAEWLCYELTSAECKGKLDRDGIFFEEDPAVKTISAHPYEYRDSGYDKGHLAPAGDMTFNSKALQESFLMSNVSPQNNEFNSGVWNDLEKQVRVWAKRFGKVFVVTGPVLKIDGDKAKLRYYNKYRKKEYSNITIPDAFYKVIFDFSKPSMEKMIAFCIPTTAPIDADIFDYVISVDELEKTTGIDFFNNLPVKVQSKYEIKSDVSLWKTR